MCYSVSSKLKYIGLILIGILFFVVVKLYRRGLFNHPEEIQKERRQTVPQYITKPPKLILFYTTLWGNKLWTGYETTERFNNWGGVPCKVQNCRVTYNKELLSKADVVIFHAFGGDMLTRRQLKKMNKNRNPNGYWIYFIHECPENAIPSPTLYDGFFNWTMGFKYDADINVLYNWEWGAWERRGINDPPVRVRNHAVGKDKLVWGGISHCGCVRELYVNKLKEYIDLDIFGKCANRFHEHPLQCPRGTMECKKQMKRYKFYLAFENTFCEDYMSEKFSETILDGYSVPIVMGGGNYKKYALPGSYINVNDFDTVEDLANYIKYLDENDGAYNKHFEYQNVYKLGKPRSWSCKICELINSDELEPKTYPRLGEWYSPKNNCGVRLNRLLEILHRSGVPGPYVDEYYKYQYEFP